MSGRTVDLSGTWRAAPADEGLRRTFADPGLDDSCWEPVPVPGHWRSTPAFAATDGPVLYRRGFATVAPRAASRWWLTFDGIFYDGDVWLDGNYVGASEGYFFGHTFEVTGALTERSEHLLAAEVGCATPADRRAKRNLTGVFQHWDCADPAANPGGIWRPVRLWETGGVRIAALRVLCSEATPERAVLSVRAVLSAATAATVVVRVTVTDVPTSPARDAADPGHPVDATVVADLLTPRMLAHGDNRIRLRVDVEEPALWWPHSLGGQPLYDVRVEILEPAGDPPHSAAGGDRRPAGADGGLPFTGGGRGDGQPRRPRRRRHRQGAVTAADIDGHVPSDVRTVRTGLRQVRMHHWVLTVNGERLFAKGTNLGPTRMALAEASPAELEGDIVAARDAGLDLVRIHAHVTRPELYDAADHHGMLVWQDLPLQWGYARGVRRQAVRQAREAVDLLGHHPCVAVWCGHNEPLALDVEPGRPIAPTRLAVTWAALQTLPTWNKTVLDPSVARTLERADPTRPVVGHSGVLPGPFSGGTDTHLYCGWYHGVERDFPRILAAVPRLAGFVTEFGAQAVPTSAAWMDPQRWPDLDWADLERHHSLQLEAFERFAPPGAYATFDEWRAATQDYQATVIRFHVETLRRLKYRPTGGFCQFCFADGQPGVTWSVLDHERRPKSGYHALAAACAPVIVIADRPAPTYAGGDAIELDVHVVSDLRRPLPGARVVATLGTWSMGWEGDVPADACARIGTVRAHAPIVAGRWNLELRLDAEGVSAANAYAIIVEGLPAP